MELTEFKGLISVTFALGEQEQKHVAGISTSDFLQLSRSKLTELVQPDLVREAVVDYDGDKVKLIFSI
jgi:hypothetical protein